LNPCDVADADASVSLLGAGAGTFPPDPPKFSPPIIITPTIAATTTSTNTISNDLLPQISMEFLQRSMENKKILKVEANCVDHTFVYEFEDCDNV
jgi:hypothetical protein